VTRSSLVSVLKYAVALAILIWMIQSDALRLDLVGAAVARRTDLVMLSAAIFFGVLQLGIVRWILLSRAQAITLTYGEALRLTLIGHFWNLAVPGAVGGDVIKAYYVAASNPDRKHEAFIAVGVDRLVGLFALFVVAAIAVGVTHEELSSSPSLRALSLFVIIVLGVALVLSCLVLSRWIRSLFRVDELLARLPLGRHLVRISEALFVYRSSLGTLLASVGISVVCHASLVVMIILCARAVAPDAAVPAATYFVVGPLGLFANAVPLTPGGLGVGETAFRELLSTATHGRVEQGGNVFLLWRACAYVWMIPGFVLFLLGKGQLRKAIRDAGTSVSHVEAKTE